MIYSQVVIRAHPQFKFYWTQALTYLRMFPVVQEMVDRMCEEAKTEMKTMNQDELGSWSRAVTSADGAWMTRGHHSKNFTFSIRHYYTGALLYRKHLCQKGRDTLINEELYQGTSKGAEGYAARQKSKGGRHKHCHSLARCRLLLFKCTFLMQRS